MASLSMWRNGWEWVTRWPAMTTLPASPGSALPGQWRSEERRVGKECRSLCDWSTDVCSSDLHGQLVDVAERVGVGDPVAGDDHVARFPRQRTARPVEIGRASCRERV